eukprot:NODE_1288_length_463_cov_36.443452_g1278_i0.p2 GENE.NODE_1288_length_463_cov_36.443452_g1278_i0~~NODE_1288_length_463_cov_36.443452_g1278_i0.p2  ORF type:complete len:50 (-),score=2.54 NODE_1288_length_463_cov_36.443452_g1278_i0:136-285(-)
MVARCIFPPGPPLCGCIPCNVHHLTKSADDLCAGISNQFVGSLLFSTRN